MVVSVLVSVGGGHGLGSCWYGFGLRFLIDRGMPHTPHLAQSGRTVQKSMPVQEHALLVQVINGIVFTAFRSLSLGMGRLLKFACVMMSALGHPASLASRDSVLLD